jgi:hypothetical protein
MDERGPARSQEEIEGLLRASLRKGYSISGNRITFHHNTSLERRYLVNRIEKGALAKVNVRVCTAGGDDFAVSVSEASSIGALRATIAQHCGVGICSFELFTASTEMGGGGDGSGAPLSGQTVDCVGRLPASAPVFMVVHSAGDMKEKERLQARQLRGVGDDYESDSSDDMGRVENDWDMGFKFRKKRGRFFNKWTRKWYRKKDENPNRF